MNAFAGQHVLSLNQFGREDLELLFDATDEVGQELARGQLHRDLEGKIPMSAFFDKSTRTQLAHETAMLRLGEAISGFADAVVTRAAGKAQESSEDLFRMLALYGDVIVTRHPVTNEPRRVPAIRPLSLTDPFYALVRAITAQQVNLKFATAIRARLAQCFGCEYRVDGESVFALEPEAMARAAVSTLQGLQLSERKASYLIGIAEAVLDGRLDVLGLAALKDEEYLPAMTRLRGIGRWTAEWFAVRVLGRAMVVAGDSGLRKAVGRLYGVAMPTELEVRGLTAHWGTAVHIAQQLVLETCVRPTAAGRAAHLDWATEHS